MRRLRRPLDKNALKKADDKFYGKYAKKYVVNGKRIPLTMKDPRKVRNEWIALYIASGGKYEDDKAKLPPKKLGRPDEPCRLADLGVTVQNSLDGTMVSDVTVEITSPISQSGTTDASGTAIFSNLLDGSYQLHLQAVGFDEVTVNVNVKPGSNATQVLLTPLNVTLLSLDIDQAPKKIIHPYNESITFTAYAQVDPFPAPPGMVYEWSVDGVVIQTGSGETFTRSFAPARTYADRRKDYNISVRVLGRPASVVVRVAQDANVGTANVAQSNAGMDTFGWTDASPAQFDTGLTAAEDTQLQTQLSLTRKVLKQTLADGTTQYGRLQFGSPTGDMDTVGWTNRAAAIVCSRASAFNWNKEEFEGMLEHETRHCDHRVDTATAGTIWRRLIDLGFASTFAPFTETIGYFQYVQSGKLSYKFLLDYGALGSFIREYNNAKNRLTTLTGATKTDAKAILQNCYSNAQYPELREAAANGWDLHIDSP